MNRELLDTRNMDIDDEGSGISSPTNTLGEDSVEKTTDRGPVLRILALTYEPPDRPVNGYRLRCYNILRRLAENHRVTLVTLVGDNEPSVDVDVAPLKLHRRFELPRQRATRTRALRNILSSEPIHVSTIPSQQVREILDAQLDGEGVDVVLANFDYFASAIPFERLSERGAIAVLDQHQMQSAYWQTVRQNHPRMMFRAYATYARWKMLRFEKRFSPEFDLCLSCTQEEGEATAKQSPSLNIVYAPNGVDTQYFEPRKEIESGENRYIGLTAGSGKRNTDAINYFAETIMPRVLEIEPNAKLLVIGNVDRRGLSDFANHDSITFTGPVPDIRPDLARASIAVAPHRYGAGSKLKVLEAMASGLPVVGTPNGLAGLEVTPGKDVLLASAPDEFANAIVRLLTNDELRRNIGDAARATAEQIYDWEGIVSLIQGALVSTLAAKRKLLAATS